MTAAQPSTPSDAHTSLPADFSEVVLRLRDNPMTWCVTGVAGFIGSNLAERLLAWDQKVVGLDNFSTGRRENLVDIESKVGPKAMRNFRFIEGDIRHKDACLEAVKGASYVLHQAALGSVPRSIADPVASHESNVSGFLNMLVAAKESGVRRLVYASSSSVYGDNPDMPKREEKTGNLLSPYAATKWMNELYAGVFGRTYGLETAGLRYFNVFGPRQSPTGPYAAVIPKWVAAMLRGEEVTVNGDGETSRDFCFIENVVEANVLAALSKHPEAPNRAYNVAVGDQTSLNELFLHLRDRLAMRRPALKELKPTYSDFRQGDIRHTRADISAAKNLLGYNPRYSIGQGLDLALSWYVENLG